MIWYKAPNTTCPDNNGDLAHTNETNHDIAVDIIGQSDNTNPVLKPQRNIEHMSDFDVIDKLGNPELVQDLDVLEPHDDFDSDDNFDIDTNEEDMECDDEFLEN